MPKGGRTSVRSPQAAHCGVWGNVVAVLGHDGSFILFYGPPLSVWSAWRLSLAGPRLCAAGATFPSAPAVKWRAGNRRGWIRGGPGLRGVCSNRLAWLSGLAGRQSRRPAPWRGWGALDAGRNRACTAQRRNGIDARRGRPGLGRRQGVVRRQVSGCQLRSVK